MIKIFIFSLLSIINITKSDNDRLSRFFNSQLYDLYIDEYKKHENQNGNKIIYHNNYLISILKSDRSKNFKHQFRSEIENFINQDELIELIQNKIKPQFDNAGTHVGGKGISSYGTDMTYPLTGIPGSGNFLSGDNVDDWFLHTGGDYYPLKYSPQLFK